MKSSRRRVIQQALVLGAGAALNVSYSPASVRDSENIASNSLYRIDIHHHYSPPFEWTPGRFEQPLPSFGGPDRHMAFMDKWGIEAAVLSMPQFALLQGQAEKLRRAAHEINEYSANLLATQGDRFGIFATIPLPDVETAISESVYALKELGLDGINMVPQYAGRYLGDAMFEPLYEVLNELEAVVYVHPAGSCCKPQIGFNLTEPFHDSALEYVFDTTRTVASLLYTTVPKRYPKIRWIFSHGGGTIPFVAFRLAELHAFDPRFSRALPEGPMPYLKEFYYETAQAFSVLQLQSLKHLVSSDKVLFGTDWPWVTGLYDETNAEVIQWPSDELPHDGDPAPGYDRVFGKDRQMVERTNALDLFPKLAARMGV